MTETATRPNTTLYVGGLDPHLVSPATLSEAFIPFGEITDITLPKPENPTSTDLHRGFGYVEFEDAADAREALDNMDRSELFGRVIKVAMAKPDVRKEGGGQVSLTAVWEQEGYLQMYAGEKGGEKRGEDKLVEDPMQGLEGLDVAGPRPEG
jgi:RNA recognition motif-containing protein